MLSEQRIRRIVDGNANMLIPWVLLASYAYYELSTPVVADAVYDEWCRRLHRVWWRVKHRHKDLITRGVSTCMVMLTKDQYPGLTVGAATLLLGERIDDRASRRRERARKRRRRAA